MGKRILKVTPEQLLNMNCSASPIREINGSGNALLRKFQLSRGLTAETQSFLVKDDFIIDHIDGIPKTLMFYACLSGNFRINYPGSCKLISNGHSGVETLCNDSAGTTEVRSGQPVQVFCVYLESADLVEITGVTWDQIIEMTDCIRSMGEKNSFMVNPRELDATTAVCAYQALSAAEDGFGNRLLLEAKALELISRQMAKLEALSGRTFYHDEHRDSEVDQILLAAEILRKEMESPPDGVTLGRRVGLCYTRLLRGFKETLGMTPVSWLRSARIQKARKLLTRGDMNVTEAAFSVGYSSLSHFTKTFTQEFGMSPREFLRNTSK